MEEIWKDIPEYEGLYQVSNLGRVKSFKWNKVRILVKKNSVDGYHMVNLSKYGKSKTIMVHKLVAIAFLNHFPNGNNMVINHKNFIRNDNKLDNLEIITNRKNTDRKHLNHSSIYTGVTKFKNANRWLSKIYINRKYQILGYFDNEYAAHLAYENELSKINS